MIDAKPQRSRYGEGNSNNGPEQCLVSVHLRFTASRLNQHLVLQTLAVNAFVVGRNFGPVLCLTV
jgi:hypothetical protein